MAGQSDTDSACGRGWANVVENELVGRIFIHNGDDSAFRATKRSLPASEMLRVHPFARARLSWLKGLRALTGDLSRRTDALSNTRVIRQAASQK